MNQLSLDTPTKQQNLQQASSQRGTLDDTVSTETYRGIPIASLPEELAQHIPKANMGPPERSLLKAAGQGDLEEVQRLLRDGANPSAINIEGESALTKAISKKHFSVARCLVDNGAATEYEGYLVYKPLSMAVKTGNLEMVELLLDKGVDVDEVAGGCSVLARAIQANFRDVTSLLLERGADPSFAPHHLYSPLGIAVRLKNEPPVKDLLKRGAETNILRQQLYVRPVKLLSESCQSLLRDWAAQGYDGPVNIIRRRSSDMAAKEKAFGTALRLASEHRQPEIYAMLKEIAKEFQIPSADDYVYDHTS